MEFLNKFWHNQPNAVIELGIATLSTGILMDNTIAKNSLIKLKENFIPTCINISFGLNQKIVS